MARAWKQLLLIVAITLLLAAGVWKLVQHPVRTLPPTVADLETVHSGVAVKGEARVGVTRLSVGDAIVTDGEGRARVRLDDGTSAVIDQNTKLSVTEHGLSLDSGRIFVLGATSAHTRLQLGKATAIVSAANAGLEKKGNTATLYSANAEIPISAGGKDYKARSGEQATIDGTQVAITPAKTFDDWTGGLAAPWGANGPPRRAVGELWGRRQDAALGDPGSPLTIRSHDVSATITGEAAETRVRTVYFNGGSNAVVGDFRMAIPPGAIVSRFRWGQGGELTDGRISLADRERSDTRPDRVMLEWAGDGWLRGNLGSISSGAAITVEIDYVEWLHPEHTKAGDIVEQYRYPLAAAAEPPLIGEFSAKVDAGPSRATAIATGLGAHVNGSVVTVRKPDFRPTADLVVDVHLPAFESGARVYVADPGKNEELKTVLVRTEVPPAKPDAGATLVLVVDTSGSAEPALLAVARSFVTAVLDALGPRDRVLVLAADQTARPVGPDKIGAADAKRKQAIEAALDKLAPGGASDLGRALEAGADALPADAPGGIVVYVGDGWPTMGDPTVDAIQARLARRAGGVPRLGAVAVGPMANRLALAALVRGSGPLLEMADASDAGSAASRLVASALQPTYSDVRLELGPEAEQIYPRHPRAVVAGGTVSVVARLRRGAPNAVVLHWRDAKGMHQDRRLLALRTAPDAGDVRRRWAAARIDDVMLTGKGREAAADVALSVGLITPWTALGSATGSYVPTKLATRLLDLSGGSSLAAFTSPGWQPSALSNASVAIPAGDSDAISLDDALGNADARVLQGAGDSVRACRDSRAALRPDLSGKLRVRFQVDGDGHADNVSVRGETPESDDAALDRCIQVVVQGLRYPDGGVTVKVEQVIVLPPPRSGIRKVKCSATSRLPLPLRRGVWRERLIEGKPADIFLAARRACELGSWSAQRMLLELILGMQSNGVGTVRLARTLDDNGQADAAAFLRREAVRRASSPEDLGAVRMALLGDERYPVKTFRKRYTAAHDDAARLAVVRKFLAVAPHDPGLCRRMLLLLEALGDKQELADETRRIRVDPFANAALLADAASALRRIGQEAEARRTFGELAERAPSDPWARAFLGDRLRNEGWFDDASAAYAALDQIMPDDAGVLIRLALANAGAGRVDIARRMLARVAQTGGRNGNPKLADLAGRLASMVLADARIAKGTSKDDEAKLVAASLEIARPTRGVSLLVLAPAATVPITATVLRGEGKAREEKPADIEAPAIGAYALSFNPEGVDEVRIRLKRPEDLPPSRPTRVRLRALIGSGSPVVAPALASLDVDVPRTGKPVEVVYKDGKLRLP